MTNPRFHSQSSERVSLLAAIDADGIPEVPRWTMLQSACGLVVTCESIPPVDAPAWQGQKSRDSSAYLERFAA